MRNVVWFILFFVFNAALFPAAADAQELTTPAPSPKGTVTQVVGIMEVSIAYSRPGVKGREIFGGLLPYGELWRTGANASTTLKFSHDVTLNGMAVPAGEYALFTVPGKDAWEIIISKDIGWGTGAYKKEDDVARFSVEPAQLSEPVERMTISVDNMTDNSADPKGFQKL